MKLFRGYKFASPAAAIIILCFFLPWVMVSCSGQPIGEFSGLEIAVGPSIDTGFGSERADASPGVLLAPLAAVLALVLMYLAGRRDALIHLDQFGLMALGVIPLLILWIGFAGAGQEAAANGFGLSYRIGWWGTMIGLLGLMIGGVLNWLDRPRPVTHSPPDVKEEPVSYLRPADFLVEPTEIYRPQRQESLPVTYGEDSVPETDIVGDIPDETTEMVLAEFTFLNGENEGERLPVLTEDVLLGRSAACEICISDTSVSRRHARLRLGRGQWFIQDQGSAAGTLVNGEKVAAGRLQSGDVIRIGNTQLRFDILS